jgi:predicted transcriptional regulator
LSKKSIILSVKSKYADLILDGKKTLEIRTKRLPWTADSRAYIYSSGDVRKIVGHCVYSGPFSAVMNNSSGYFSEHILEDACLSAQELKDYLDGRYPNIYRLSGVVRYTEPIELSDFGFENAPQSWAYTRYIPASVMFDLGVV